MSKRIALIRGRRRSPRVSPSGRRRPHRRSTPRAQSSHLLVGINDEANTLYGNPATAFATLTTLKTQVLRVNLYWGGNKWAVANKKPTDATDPGDPAYNWALYDRLVAYATPNNIKVVFSILFTPSWANGGKAKHSRADEPEGPPGLRLCGRRALQRPLDAAELAAGSRRSASATRRFRR